MKLVAALLATLLLAGCARRDLTLIPEAELPEDVYAVPEPSPTTSPLPREGVIYLVDRNRLRPQTVPRLQPVGSLPEALLFALFQWPTDTSIPEGTRLNDVSVRATVATVDLSGEFEEPGEPRSQALRIAQVVYTLTEPGTGVQAVEFEIEDVPQEAIGGVSLGPIPGPVTRVDYAQFEPQPRTGREGGGKGDG